MKKIILAVGRFTTCLLAALLAIGLFSLYLMLTVPAIFWIGRGMTGYQFINNFGSLFLDFLKNDYQTFFLLPFMPILAAFFLLSVFIWVYYRHDKEAGILGFKNTVLCVLSFFLLIEIPVLSYSFDQKKYRSKEIKRLLFFIKIMMARFMLIKELIKNF